MQAEETLSKGPGKGGSPIEMFDRIWQLAQILKGKSKGASEREIAPMPLRHSLRDTQPEPEAVASRPPPPPLPPGPPPGPPPGHGGAEPLPPGPRVEAKKGDKGKGDEAVRGMESEKGCPKGGDDSGSKGGDDSAKAGSGKGKGAGLPAPKNLPKTPPKTPAEASRPKAKNMPPAAGAGKGLAGPSPRKSSGSWVQCWMWMPTTSGSGIAPYLPADVASGVAPDADWGKGPGKVRNGQLLQFLGCIIFY